MKYKNVYYCIILDKYVILVNFGGIKMNIEEMINDILQKEDIKNPLTDEEIAKELNILREVVTEYRKKNDIANSRNRRLDILTNDSKEILLNNKDISDRNFVILLKERGYKIERYAAAKIKKEVLEYFEANQELKNQNKKSSFYIDTKKIREEKVIINKLELNENNEKSEFFDELIGSNGSLKVQINQAKAAITYPPKGLHVLLLGASGVGKSHLADAMYKFAKGTNNFKEDCEFVVFNCADYADNPQLLLSQLFGSVKGAYTGATENKKGIVEICNGGILFLDEIHRLPPEGQEILFSILDRGTFRRLGETNTTRKSDVMIIAATTESVESSLLLTFRRRIPMVIEIPAVKDRPYEERFELINQCFLAESYRIMKDIVVSKDVIRMFMKYDCPGNIGQLKSDIQVACAIGFLQNNIQKRDKLYIDLNHIPDHIKQCDLSNHISDEEIERFIVEDILISYKHQKHLAMKNKENKKIENIYKFIENRQRDLQFAGYDNKEISKILSQQVELELIRRAKSINYNNINQEELINLVGIKTLETVKQAVKIAKKQLPSLQPNIIYPLAVHLNSTYERVLANEVIINPKLEIIKSKYEYEFQVAIQMCDVISERLNVILPEDEVGFIAMYLKNYREKFEQEQGKVAVIVMTHGKVASAMAEVANKFLGVEHAIGLDMEFSDSPDLMLEKAIEIVKKANQGKGCIILVDMGSLVTFGDIITAKTGIDTRVISRVDTLLVLEAVRKSALADLDLEVIYQDLENESKKITYSSNNIDNDNVSRVIVTLCITGKGSALKIKEYVESRINLNEENIELISLGYMDENITDTLNNISRTKKIEAIIGTINPEYNKVPFISFEELMRGRGVINLKNILESEEENKLSEIINEDVVFVGENYRYKDEALEKMTQKLIEGGYVEPGFLLSVFKREMLADTYLKGGIAIPHGSSEFITKPTILVTKLANKIVWSENYEVDLVFLIALKDDSKNYFEKLYKIIKDEKVLNKIKSSVSKDEILEIILK